MPAIYFLEIQEISSTTREATGPMAAGERVDVDIHADEERPGRSVFVIAEDSVTPSGGFSFARTMASNASLAMLLRDEDGKCRETTGHVHAISDGWVTIIGETPKLLEEE
jgi:hypothetical protein